MPLSEAGAAVNERVAVVTPEKIPAFDRLTQAEPSYDCHWYVSPVPVAVTVNYTFVVSQIAMLVG